MQLHHQQGHSAGFEEFLRTLPNQGCRLVLGPLPDYSFLASFQLYGRRAPWEDPAKWVMDTYPWAASPQQHEWPPLLQLRPEDVGFDSYSIPREGSTSKQMPPSDAEGDPLVSSRLPEQLGLR